MIKWGTTFGSHDGALAVFQDDKLVFASDAERWSRKKNDPTIPDNLIKFAEDNWGVPDQVHFYEDYTLKTQRREFAGQSPLKPKRFKYNTIGHNHHWSHARYGYWTSPFDECTVLVVDAIGEWDTLTQWKVKNDFECVKRWRYPKSIGLFYSAMTQAAGWKPNEEEYILMGASAVKKHKIENYNIVKELWNNDVNFHTGININFDKFEISNHLNNLSESLNK